MREPHPKAQLSNGTTDILATIITDGTETVVELKHENGTVIGEGFSRRRKGERRNDDVGVALASARAFEDAARMCYEEAEALLK